jgi:hypothetical protein
MLPGLFARLFLFATPGTLLTLVAAACGGAADESPSDTGASGAGSAEAGPKPIVKTAGCCMPSNAPAASMSLGGKSDEVCVESHDFWCTTNWRLEKDDAGCAVWRYDTVAPGPGQTAQCQPVPDAGVDAGRD